MKRQKKIENAEHRILTVEVNKEAACLKPCCIHCKPTFDSAVFGTCNIHMEPNEWWRFLSRLELLCRQSTLDHFECNIIHKVAKKAAANSKHGGIVMVPVPELRTIPQDAPLRVLF